jgi:hypothetical protein
VAINENKSFHGNSGDDGRAAGENSTNAVDSHEILNYDHEKTEGSTLGTSISSK